ncbi:MAG: hypothetical protein K2Y22_06395 [Candidatus Obscuribacterales bacterium]|nr:hypothetical protein [Candidatus Obscuribacterales bacterium]
MKINLIGGMVISAALVLGFVGWNCHQRSAHVDADINTNMAPSVSSTIATEKAEPESFNESSSEGNMEQQASTDQQAESQPEEQSDANLRTDMTDHGLTVAMVHLEGRIAILESRLSVKTPRLARVKQLLQHAKDSVKTSRDLYVAHEENMAERIDYMMRLASYEFESACDIAGEDLKSIYKVEPDR